MSRRARLNAMGLTGCIVFLHFEFYSIDGYPLTVAPLALLAVLLSGARRRHWPVPLGALVAMLLGLPIVTALASPYIQVDGTEYLKTYLLWSFAVAALALGVIRPLTGRERSWLGVGCFAGLVSVSMFSIVQRLLASKGSTALFNPWKSHQYLYEYDLHAHLLALRAPAFYLEPSFNALVITSLLFVLLLLRHRIVCAFALATLGLLCAASVSGFAILALLSLLSTRALPRKRSVETRIVSRISILMLIAVSLWISRAYLTQRVSSASIIGSSTQYRLMAPLPVLQDVLWHSPLGLPLGSIQQVLPRYDLLNGRVVGSTLDNGLYLLIFYFGWVALAAALVVSSRLLFVKSRKGHFGLRSLAAFSLLTFANTGGILLPEFIFLYLLVILAFRLQPKPSGVDNAPSVFAVYRHRNSEQSERSARHQTLPV
jgi:putative colanic acid polymerase